MDGRYKDIKVTCEDGVTSLVLNRPEQRNGVDPAFCRDIYDALREIAASPARVVVMHGAGNDFCVGAYLGREVRIETPSFAELEPLYQSAVLLHQMPQVTLAAIDGGCAGAGMGWACACDLRYATPQARFATAFINVGVSGDMGLGWTLTHMLGSARARELLLLSEKFDGARALDIGLVSGLFARDELHEEVMAIARHLAQRDPVALRLLKANLVSAEKLDFPAFIDIESARHLHTTGHLSAARRQDTATASQHGE